MAVLKKQLMDTSHNWGIIIQFLLYPVLLLCLIFSLPKDNVIAKVQLVVLISTMLTGLVPILTINNIIRSDKATNTLRMLIMSTVKPIEYLIGITANILFLSLITAFILGLVGGLDNLKLLCFIGVLMLGIGTSLLLGSAMAIQGGGVSLIILVSLINGLIPVFGTFNASFYKISQFLYTQQISGLIGDIYGNYRRDLPRRFSIIGVNFIIFLVIFVISYKRNRFYGEK